MAELLEYKCPCCTGALEFSPGVQKIKCPYCDTEFDLDTFHSLDEALAAEGTEQMEWNTAPGSAWAEGEADGIAVYVCQSCGGEIVGDETTGATSCPYCGNPVVMARAFSGELRPDAVIPFKLDREAAKAAYKKHLSGKKLLPKVFKDENHLDEIRGIYVPFWLFDADADADIRYKATRVRRWSDSRYHYTETSHYNLFRAGSLSFDKIPADGSSKLSDELMESIEPYDYSDLVDFRTAYLAGYLADKYDLDAEANLERVTARAKSTVEREFAATCTGYATAIPEESHVRLVNSRAQYALLPVWILNTTWKEQKFIFAMNGQTGKFVGNLPCDVSLMWKYFFGTTGIVAAAAALLLIAANYL